jgi:hypothetical protein
VIDVWAAIRLDELFLDMDETDADLAVAKMERLHREVLPSRVERWEGGPAIAG